MDKFRQLRLRFEQRNKKETQSSATQEAGKETDDKKQDKKSPKEDKKNNSKPVVQQAAAPKPAPKPAKNTKVKDANSKPPPSPKKSLLKPPPASPQTEGDITKENSPDRKIIDRERKCSFSEEKLQEIRDTFTVFDKNRDGMITKEELGAVMSALGQRPTVRELQALIRSVDADESGTIDFDEFVKIFSQKMCIDPEKELFEVFCIFDKDLDGFISPNDVFEMLHQLGENITRREATEMVKEADLNGDGKVDYSEFKSILTKR